ncbi:MAG TPA: hypothetical protein VHD87_10940 [Acidimicrobiales bacterium]|nr:hypothetical protein [Acidimicrobiales bacterium]
MRIRGGGWTGARVPVDGFALVSDESTAAVLRNDRFDLTVYRRPTAGERPPIALTAKWERDTEPVVLASVTER